MKKIIYKTEIGIAIITPTRSIAEAMKDIPKGAEYKIIDESELPQDRTYRNAWTYDLKIDVIKKAEIDARRKKITENEEFVKQAPDIIRDLQTRITDFEKKLKVQIAK